MTVDGRDQFRLWGAFRSGPLPKVVLRYARDHAVEASVMLPGRMRHVRRIEWDDGEVRVVDQLVGRGRHRVVSRLVLAPDPPSFEVAFEPGDLVVERSWLSDRFGERVETLANTVEVQLDLPAELGFRIRFAG